MHRKNRNSYRILKQKPDGKRPLEDSDVGERRLIEWM
jgi:hypothetical protein